MTTHENVIGNRLMSIRTRANMTDKQFARYLGIPVKTYRMYESGEKTPENLPHDILMMLYCE